MKAIDLFAGVGGWDLAAREFGYDPIGFEINTSACLTREAAGLPTIQTDLSKYPIETITGQVELLVASPPCQTFSVAGKNAGARDWQYIEYALELAFQGEDFELLRVLCSDARSMLVVEPAKWIYALDPIFIAMEQVPPILPLWERYARLLQERGYCTWVGICHAECYGVPQTRKRAILLASKMGPLGKPQPTHSRYYSRHPEQFDEGVLPWVSMAETLGWGYAVRPMSAVCAHPEESNFSSFGIDGGSGARTIREKAIKAGTWIVGFPRKNDQDDGLEYRARDLRSDSFPAATLTEKIRGWEKRPASTIVGGRRGAEGIIIGRQLPPGEETNPKGGGWSIKDHIRITPPSQDGIRVTEAEAGVLQSFPFDYPWQGKKSHRFQQIGNAIPPRLAYACLKELLRY